MPLMAIIAISTWISEICAGSRVKSGVPLQSSIPGIGICALLFMAMGLLFVGGFGVSAGEFDASEKPKHAPVPGIFVSQNFQQFLSIDVESAFRERVGEA